MSCFSWARLLAVYPTRKYIKAKVRFLDFVARDPQLK